MKHARLLMVGAVCAAALWAGTAVIGSLDFAHIATPDAPASGTRLYAKSDGKVYARPSGGAEALVQGVGKASVKFVTGGITGTTGWAQDTWTELPGTATEVWDIGDIHTGTNAYATANRAGKWQVSAWSNGSVKGGFFYVAPCINGGAAAGSWALIGAVSIPQWHAGVTGNLGYGTNRWTGVLDLANNDTVSVCVYRSFNDDNSADNEVFDGALEMTDLGF
jgi:hypothetical protein